MRAKQRKKVNPKEFFDPVLFWDAENIDIEKHACYIISRVLNFGDEKDIRELRSIYPDKKIIEAVRKRRSLLPETGKFWAVYFKIPLKEIACLRMYYRNMRLK